MRIVCCQLIFCVFFLLFNVVSCEREKIAVLERQNIQINMSIPFQLDLNKKLQHPR